MACWARLLGGALGHWDNVPVAVCRLSVGNGRDPVNRCTLNIDTWDYSHAPLCSGIRKHCFLKVTYRRGRFIWVDCDDRQAIWRKQEKRLKHQQKV